MPTPLHRIFYVSRSLATPLQVEELLAGARVSNARRGLTGSLVFTGGHFAQLLEGPADAVAETMAAIAADSRHEALKRLLEGGVARRRFADWTMGYAEAPGADDLLASLIDRAPLTADRADRLLDRLFRP